MRRTLKGSILAPAALLLALVCSGARAYGQRDSFIDGGGVTRDGGNASWSGLGSGVVGNSGSWTGFTGGGVGGNEASWNNFQTEDPYAPVGSGLLVLAASGVCYAAFRSRRRRE